MLTQVDVYGAVNSATALPLSGAGVYGDPVQIKKIDGLGPVKADIQTATYGAINREYLTGKFYGKRNIVLTLGLNPDWATQTVEELRQLLYAYFTPTQQVELRFQSTHLPEVNIFGYVESMDPNIFSADPEIDVSIIHPDGVSELYLGQVAGPRIDLATDAVLRTAGAKEYTAATRLYGLVENHLLWAWDIAALGQELRTHASARLAKVD